MDRRLRRHIYSLVKPKDLRQTKHVLSPEGRSLQNDGCYKTESVSVFRRRRPSLGAVWTTSLRHRSPIAPRIAPRAPNSLPLNPIHMPPNHLPPPK